jgi:hypothetical protein
MQGSAAGASRRLNPSATQKLTLRYSWQEAWSVTKHGYDLSEEVLLAMIKLLAPFPFQ